jgi:hypothetical protein
MFEIDQRTNPTPWLRKVALGGKPKWPLVADCVEKVLAAVGSQFFKGRWKSAAGKLLREFCLGGIFDFSTESAPLRRGDGFLECRFTGLDQKWPRLLSTYLVRAFSAF